MNPKSEEVAVIETLLRQLNESRLPRLLELQERTRHGEAINDFDLQLLEDVMHDIHSIQALAHDNPELEKIVRPDDGVAC